MILHGEVDYRRGATKGGCPRPALEIVGRRRAPEWQIHMRVRVDSTGNNQPVGSIDGLVDGTCNLIQILSYEGDCRTIDKNVGDVGIDGCDHMAVPNERFHGGKL